MLGTIIGVNKGDTRSLDIGSRRDSVGFWAVPLTAGLGFRVVLGLCDP